MKRRHSATAAAAKPSIIEVYAKAISRKRERLTLATEYTHANLVAYLSNEVLPAGWVVHAPSCSCPGVKADKTKKPDNAAAEVKAAKTKADSKKPNLLSTIRPSTYVKQGGVSVEDTPAFKKPRVVVNVAPK
jgi:hypothetical protein